MNDGEIWDHINDSVNAGAWPFVVLVCAIVAIVLFREQIGERISKIVKAKAGPLSVDLQAGREANEVFGEVVPEVLGQPEPKAIAAGPGGADKDPKVVTVDGHIEGRATITAEADVVRAEGTVTEAHSDYVDELRERREPIEDIIRASWRAGYEAGHPSESADPPEPNILWFGSTPRIVGWNAVVRPKTVTATARVPGLAVSAAELGPSETVRRLEAEIRRLREKGADMPQKSASGDYLLYRELLEKLRRLDPASPFA